MSELADHHKHEEERPAPLFLNFYDCPACGADWCDAWTAQVDDDCPACGMRHISPTRSEDA